MKHKGKRIFISGIPTSGKSYLAKKLSESTSGVVVSLDDFRENLSGEYEKWANFYFDKDEETYLTQTTPEDKWQDLVSQSEGVWPAFLEEINKYKYEEKSIIFDCVSILPHLAKRDLDFPGIVLLGRSLEETTERNKKDPRWGDTAYLQELEAKTFFEIERPRYKEEAIKYGYPFFESADDAYQTALKLLS